MTNMVNCVQCNDLVDADNPYDNEDFTEYVENYIYVCYICKSWICNHCSVFCDCDHGKDMPIICEKTCGKWIKDDDNDNNDRKYFACSECLSKP